MNLYKESTFKKIFNACFSIVLKHSNEIEAELKFAVFLREICSFTDDIKIIHKIVDSLASEFALGHFLDIKRINFHLLEARNEISKSLIKK